MSSATRPRPSSAVSGSSGAVMSSAVAIEPTWPAALKTLLGRDAAEMSTEYFRMLDADALAVRPRQVAYRSGSSTTVRYDVDVRWPSGTTTTEPLVALLGRKLPEHAIRMGRGEDTVALWHWPNDPMLPGLAAAIDPGHVGRLFADLGLGDDPVVLRVRAYRPGRRAVVEADNGTVRVFLKVVRPHRAEALHETHRSLAGRLPVPDSIGWTNEGIVVLPGIGGATLREVLHSDGDVPDPAEIDSLLDHLPAELAERALRTNWLDLARLHADSIATTVPGAARRVGEVIGRLDAASDAAVEHPVVPIHGDMYEAQLMVEGGRVVGLLDVDTAGAGHRVDDIANFCAHLSVLALVSRPSAPIRRFGARLLAHAEQRHDRADLRLRIAGAVVGLATGSFRVLEPDWERHTLTRLDLAGDWIASARRDRPPD